MRAIVLVFSAFMMLVLSGCKTATCEGGGVYTCKNWQRRTECSVNSRGTVICQDREVCVNYGCVRDPINRYEAALAPSVNLRDVSTSGVMSMIANGDMLAAQSMGFELNDVFSLLNGRSLSEERVKSIARIAGESEPVVARKIESINAEFQIQRHDFKSPYWQTCVASGRWSTDQNSRCEKAYWPGCSPEQGASLCISDLGASRFGN